MFQLIKEEDPAQPKNVVITIFGQPGTGKTSLSYTADNPLLMDYDEGYHRAVNRKDTVTFNNWFDVRSFINQGYLDEVNPSTLICDTAGTMLDNYIGKYVTKQDAKNEKKGGGVSLQGYQAMQYVFDDFLGELRSREVDLIIIAHAKEKDEGDATKMRPKVTGGSYDILIAKSDLVGYMSMKNNHIRLDFNPTDEYIGKNCGEFTPMDVPHYSEPEYQTFMADIIRQTKERMVAQSDAQKKSVEVINSYKEKIDNCQSLDDANQIFEEMQELTSMQYKQVLSHFDKKYIELWEAHYFTQCTEATDYNNVMEIARELPKRLGQIRHDLVKHAKENLVEFDSKQKQFVDKQSEETENQ